MTQATMVPRVTATDPDSGPSAGRALSQGVPRPPMSWRRLVVTLLPALALVALAAVLRLWIGPLSERLPAGYASEIFLESDTAFRETPNAPAESIHQGGRRVDQVLTATDDVAVIQSHVDWSDDAGQVTYQTTGLYGVDRRSRANVAGYGDANRQGQFLFPPHLQRIIDQVWDPYYTGPRTLTFDHHEEIDGLPVAVYRFDVTGMDETAGYDFLPDVPERFGAMTDGHGQLWIEPISGVLVDFTDKGHSYFLDRATGRSVGDVNVWDAHYTPKTRAAQLQLAASARQKILAMEVWFPLALLGAGLVWLTVGLLLSRRAPRFAMAKT